MINGTILIPVLLASPVRLMGFYEFSQTISFPHIDFLSYLSKIYIFLWMLTKAKCARTHPYSKADMWSSVGINCDIPALYILQSQKYGLKKITSHTPWSRSLFVVENGNVKYFVEWWNKEMVLFFFLYLLLQFVFLAWTWKGHGYMNFFPSCSMFWEQALFFSPFFLLLLPCLSLLFSFYFLPRIF